METAFTASKNPRSLRVLVADDTVISRVIVTRTLEIMGHRAKAVKDGVEALQALKDGAYDVVLLDGQMPNMGGAETAQAIRADVRTRALPIIGLTAGEADEQAALLAAGMDAVIEKPVQADVIAAVIEAVLAEREKLTASAAGNPFPASPAT